MDNLQAAKQTIEWALGENGQPEHYQAAIAYALIALVERLDAMAVQITSDGVKALIVCDADKKE